MAQAMTRDVCHDVYQYPCHDSCLKKPPFGELALF